LKTSAFPDLFAVIGNAFGGDGVNTFALPDLRGRVAIGAGQGPTLQNYELAQAGGAESVTLTQAQLPSHTHAIACNSQTGSQTAPDQAFPGVSAQPLYAPQADGTLFSTTMLAPSSPEPATPHSNMQAYLGLQWCIAAIGTSPFGGA
jgi:microcystin-dependent protein